MIGERLAHFRITERVGAGGMGVVYRAHDEQLQRTVALKVLPESVRDDARANDRLLREARAASALNHPNICTVFAVGEDRGHTFIAMEYLTGSTLRELIPHGGMPVSTAVRYGIEIADALAHAHAHGVLHRDLKSANVMVTDEGRTRVLDFGLSRRYEAEVSEETTRETLPATEAGVLSGTPHYLAPELLVGRPAHDGSDIWSIGILLFEMVSGGLPFKGRTVPELCASILREPPAPLPEGIPSRLGRILTRCLEKAPEHRYRSAAEVRAALETLTDEAPERVKPTDPPPAPRRLRDRAWFRTVAAVGVLAGVLWMIRGLLPEPADLPAAVELVVVDEFNDPVSDVMIFDFPTGERLGTTDTEGRTIIESDTDGQGSHIRLVRGVEGRSGYVDVRHRIADTDRARGRLLVRVRADHPTPVAAGPSDGGNPVASGPPRDGSSTGSGGAVHSYTVSTAPGYAEVYLDGSEVNLNLIGKFTVDLAPGIHTFHVVNRRAGIDLKLDYEVGEDDDVQRLLLNWDRGVVVTRP